MKKRKECKENGVEIQSGRRKIKSVEGKMGGGVLIEIKGTNRVKKSINKKKIEKK